MEVADPESPAPFPIGSFRVFRTFVPVTRSELADVRRRMRRERRDTLAHNRLVKRSQRCSPCS